MKVFRCFTHDLRSPVVGGEPWWTGTLPHQLPQVAFARSDFHCGEGWAACRSPSAAVEMSGLWPDGRPIRVFEGETIGSVHETFPEPGKLGGPKLHCESIFLEREVPLEDVLIDLCAAHFGQKADRMYPFLWQWCQALKRPMRNEHAVGYSLWEAMKARGEERAIFLVSQLPLEYSVQLNIEDLQKEGDGRQHKVHVRVHEGNNSGWKEVINLKSDRIFGPSGLHWLEPGMVWPERKRSAARDAKAAVERFLNHRRTDMSDGIIDAFRFGMLRATELAGNVVFEMEAE